MNIEELINRSGLKVLGAVVVLVLAWAIVKRLMGAAPSDAQHSSVQCQNCRWQGSVSKYKPRCPKCGQLIS